MAARIYRISLCVEKYFTSEHSEQVKYFIHTNEIPGELYYAAKGAIYYVTIATVIFSHGKITCYFHV